MQVQFLKPIYMASMSSKYIGGGILCVACLVLKEGWVGIGRDI